jgi:hypothetical protein
MHVESVLAPPRGAAASRPQAIVPRKIDGVKLWGLAGAVMFAFALVILIRWVTGPYFKTVPAGPTSVPEAMKIAIVALAAVGIPAAAGFVWNWLWRPWRRDRRVTAEGLLVLYALTFEWFWDPFLNYFNAYFTYNNYLPNMGSWVAEIPGWSSIAAGTPGHTMAYPLEFVIPGYIVIMFGLCVAAATFMRRMRSRHPAISNASLLVLTYLFITSVWFVIDAACLRSGIWCFHGSIPSVTLWYGHYYQMPIPDAVFCGFWFTGIGALLHFRNDKGETLVERGTNDLRWNPKVKLGLRFAALSAASALLYAVTYNVPYMLINNSNERWPASTQRASYLTNFICGPETNVACPSPDLPIARRGAVWFTPQGMLRVPKGGAPPAASGQVTSFAR